MSQKLVRSDTTPSASANQPSAPKKLKQSASFTAASIASSPPESDDASSAADVVELSDDEPEKAEVDVEHQLGKHC